jgi:simple sugar transport system ATP-binding protein
MLAGRRCGDATRLGRRTRRAHSEDRHAVGVIGDLAVWENTISERLRTPAFTRAGFVRRPACRTHADTIVRRFDVRLSGIDVPARSLSGGNMQKLILGRALTVGAEATPTFILADQPTWGLDIGALAYVHQCLLDAAGAGAAVLLISEDWTRSSRWPTASR